MKKFLFLPLILLFIACTTAINDEVVESDELNNVDQVITELEEGSFVYGEDVDFGNLFVNGYVELEERSQAFCVEDCETYTYVLFRVVESGNEYFYKFLEALDGNSFVSEDGVYTGCVEEGVISYWNSSDEFGMQEYVLSSELSDAILSSTELNPITIELDMYPLELGSGAPDCYSYFTYVKEIE